MTQTQTQLPYRAPAGRPRAIPPCDVTAPVWRETTTTAPADGRPVREPGESAGHYGARVLAWMDRLNPARKDARNAKMVATRRKKYLLKKRQEAAATVNETATARWHIYSELAQITGYTATRMLQLTRERGWPIKQLRRVGHNGRPLQAVFGEASTLPVKAGYRIVTRQEPKPKPAPVLILAPPVAKQIAQPRRSLWQRIMRWFK